MSDTVKKLSDKNPAIKEVETGASKFENLIKSGDLVFEQREVRIIARNHLRQILKPVPSAFKLVTTPRLFEKWVTLCTGRCNMLHKEGYIVGRNGFEKFVEKGARQFADRVLMFEGLKPGGEKADFTGFR